jgi:hypothetical protein
MIPVVDILTGQIANAGGGPAEFAAAMQEQRERPRDLSKGAGP